MPTDKDFYFGSEHGKASDEWLKAAGTSLAAESLAKAEAALAKFSAAIDDLDKRLSKLEAEPPEVDRQTRIAKLNPGATQ
jgi:predicted aminopeptidase